MAILTAGPNQKKVATFAPRPLADLIADLQRFFEATEQELGHPLDNVSVDMFRITEEDNRPGREVGWMGATVFFDDPAPDPAARLLIAIQKLGTSPQAVIYQLTVNDLVNVLIEGLNIDVDSLLDEYETLLDVLMFAVGRGFKFDLTSDLAEQLLKAVDLRHLIVLPDRAEWPVPDADDDGTEGTS